MSPDISRCSLGATLLGKGMMAGMWETMNNSVNSKAFCVTRASILEMVHKTGCLRYEQLSASSVILPNLKTKFLIH